MSAPKADNVENNEQESLLERKIREVELYKELESAKEEMKLKKDKMVGEEEEQIK